MVVRQVQSSTLLMLLGGGETQENGRGMVPFGSLCKQGWYIPWKTGKVMEFQTKILGPEKVMEFVFHVRNMENS